jgi:hypothetical protein
METIITRKTNMKSSFSLNTLFIAAGAVLLTGCGDAETTINELPPIVEETPVNPGTGGGGGTGDFLIESDGRLAAAALGSNQISVFDLDDNSMLDSFGMIYDGNSLLVSADYRFAVIRNRDNDYVGFIDGALWREDHVDHLHDYEQMPQMSSFELFDSKPTHIDSYNGLMAIFNDGDADAGLPASVVVMSDMDIASENDDLARLNFSNNMHGVAKPRGEFLIASVRRDDAESTSANPILPDQVGVFHLHNGEYEQELVFDVTCPNLHGAGQNSEFVAFGCGDGVLVVHEHSAEDFEAEKIMNIAALGSARIGSLYAHSDSETMFGTASNRATGESFLLAVNPEEMEMEEIDWQPVDGASPISFAFSYSGEHFVILDNQGFVSILEAHEHDGHMHWEFHERVDVIEDDVAGLPEGASFSMTMSQSHGYVYVSDPIAQHIVKVNLESLAVSEEIELNFVPTSIAWLGIAEEHDH